MAGCALLVLGLGDLDDAAVVPAALRCIWQNLVVKPLIIQEHSLYTNQVEQRESARLGRMEYGIFSE